ncbi:MAG: DUF962 domain-containing protein [Minwuiales bacterium]|nr:DUF962 domain-containing protein [Minwuiales bacterium]
MHGYFVEQMAMYSSYHRDLRNKLTHFIGVPAIAFSLLIPTAWLEIAQVGPYTVSVATLLAVAVMLFWILLDAPLGISTALFYIPFLAIADWISGMTATTGWIVFAVFFVGGWVFQLVGHGFEGRKPALVDNLLQIFIAPMFLMAEVWFALGLRRGLHDEVENRWRDYLPDNAAADGQAAEAR